MKKTTPLLFALILITSISTRDFSYVEESLVQLEPSYFGQEVEAILGHIQERHESIDYSNVGIYIEELRTGNNWVYNNGLVYDPSTDKTKGLFSSASAVKLPMAYASLRYMEINDIPLRAIAFDPLSKDNYVLSEAIRDSIVTSSVAAYNKLVRWLTIPVANATLEADGIINSTINSEMGLDAYWSLERNLRVYGTANISRFTPEDYGLILKSVYNKSNEGNPYQMLLMQSLIDNKFHSRIPRGVSYRYEVAHKTGTYMEGGKISDAGIVLHPTNPYIIVVLTDKQDDFIKTEKFIRDFVWHVDELMSKRTLVINRRIHLAVLSTGQYLLY
jgi:hypothetical protein